MRASREPCHSCPSDDNRHRSFASSAPSGMSDRLIEYFGFSEELATLTITLFIFGYCVGPLFWGPLSEQYGRRPVFLVSFPVYICFTFGCALSRNTTSIMIFRLLCGVFAAAPMSNSGALISDIWDAQTRGKALSLFIIAPFMAPAWGTILSGYLAESALSWRWLFWIMAIIAGVSLLLIAFTLPETYGPVLLVQKARALRADTGDDRYTAPLELAPPMSISARAHYTVSVPFKMLVQEPTLIATTVYMSFLYGCMYLLFEAFPIVYIEGHHFGTGPAGLVWIPPVIGVITSVLVYIQVFEKRYTDVLSGRRSMKMSPELRLESAIWGAPLFAGSFFWFGWTSDPSISYWSPLMAGLVMGFAIIWIFLALFNYIIEVYLSCAASALAANTVVRSIAAAGFPLFASQMYRKLSPQWASTVIGCCSVLMIPIPFVLQRFGPALRRKSRFVPASNRT
ncbi:MFS general substrate transporter [Daedalea quercina L-15889]|uniref:MFS general substrate transporter n=1 Tax=Daedalea quercina L-15889 TaxID=1314783 RepID=A0A165RTH9_9APHY|nr:MFS general substrate transporter [Daedalea quercina L-15889]